MSDSNRGGVDKAQLKQWLAGAVSIALIFICVGSIQHWIYYNEASSHAAGYARDAQNQIATECRMPLATPDCESKIDRAARQEQRDEYDLYSQKAMALWTAIMGAMAVIGISLSGVGVYLIWRTWDATREAAESSRKTLHSFIAKERAIIAAMGADFHFLDTAKRDRNGFKIRFENIGSSAGVIQEIAWQYADQESWLPDWKPTIHGRKMVIPPNDAAVSPHLGVDNFPSDPCWLMGYARYKTLEDEVFKCYFFFKVHQPKSDFVFGPEWYASLERHPAMPEDQ